MWAHYRFRQRLLFKAREHGKVVIVVNEAYTSKTCTRCGELNEKLGGSKKFKCRACGLVLDRDINDARNIALRTICSD